MAVPQVVLTGAAVTGLGPLNARSAVAALPVKVCLGRIVPKAHPACLRMTPYLSRLDASTLPTSINRRDKAALSIARMYLNDQLGCCVIAGKFHLFGVLSANDSDSGGIVVGTDAEVKQQYEAICGPGDNGCVITHVLDVARSKGLVLGGKTYRIDGYVAVDWTNKDETKAAQVITGANTIGINLPSAWTQNAVWDVTNTPIVGGHDVTPIDYDEQGVYISSWGRIYLITWAAWLSRRWLSEYYAVLAPLWYGSDGVNSVTGLDAATLKADLVKLGNGVIPDVTPPGPGPGPGPTPPPVPPPAPKPLITITLSRTVPTGGLIQFRTPVTMPPGKYGISPLAADPAGPLVYEAQAEAADHPQAEAGMKFKLAAGSSILIDDAGAGAVTIRHEAQPTGATSMTQLPDAFPTEAVAILLPLLRGTVPQDKRQAATAGWNVVGYGLSVYVPNPPVMGVPVSTEQVAPAVINADAVAEHLERARSYQTGPATPGSMGALPPIPWQQIVQTLLPLILGWLQGGK